MAIDGRINIWVLRAPEVHTNEKQMKKLGIAITFSAFLALGCVSEDTGQVPDGYKPKGTPPAGGLAMPGATKCQQCGKEVSKSQLVGRDGKFICKECNAS
ncbi:MAG TPA: hypothetical protein VK171_08200 [Fimbriimonas sp.]|nr:hypothetical protein [Fimbriimonas sp.]